jgi:hypothetical protein
MDLVIPKRSVLLAIFLTATLVFILAKTYLLWTDGPWDFAEAPRVSSPAPTPPTDSPASPPRLAATDFIVAKNLFDPERGATQTKEVEANSRAVQRIRGLILVGTMILGESRYAIIQESGAQAPGRPAQGQSNQTMRFKLGDTFEGFSLSQIQDNNVVFTNGASRVELALDYFRKVEAAAPAVASVPRPQPGASTTAGARPGPVAPRVVPQLPRRERLPQRPSS